MGAKRAYNRQDGFTLIELSIVLVIIGLIVGGVLAGQNLIAAAAVRAQISQIEKFNTAANTFFGKYGYLPGDIPAAPAAQFGFISRGTLPGEGDGNGVIEGNYNNTSVGNYGWSENNGETVVFWVDLSSAGLIEGGFNTANSSTGLSSATVSGTGLNAIYPAAKLGSGNYVYVWSGGYGQQSRATGNATNYFGLSAVSALTVANGCTECLTGNPGLTVQQAYAIDTKIDDGLPQTGRVLAIYLNSTVAGSSGIAWAAGGGAAGTSDTSQTSGSSTTCYDNSSAAGGAPGVSGAIQHYSVEMNNGSSVNCALSFRMQAGD